MLCNYSICCLFLVDITGLSPEARKSYDSALQGGERKVPHIRALFCGPGRVGKTSLGRSMLGQKFTIQVDSTIGVELQKIVCTVVRHKDSKSWVWRAEKDEEEQQRLLAKKVLKDEVRERAEADDDSVPSCSASQGCKPTDDATEQLSMDRKINSYCRGQRSSESEHQTKLQEEATLYVKHFLEGIHQQLAEFASESDDDMCFVDL